MDIKDSIKYKNPKDPDLPDLRLEEKKKNIDLHKKKINIFK